MSDIRELPALNGNYDPPRPWVCLVTDPHDCGPVIGAMGATPVCAKGAEVERQERDADRARIDAWANSAEGRRAIAEELAMERRIEFAE